MVYHVTFVDRVNRGRGGRLYTTQTHTTATHAVSISFRVPEHKNKYDRLNTIRDIVIVLEA